MILKIIPILIAIIIIILAKFIKKRHFFWENQPVTREKTNKLNKELQGKLQNAEVYQDELRRKLQKHDLTRLSEKKPGLVEKKINEGTQKLFNDFESITAK